MFRSFLTALGWLGAAFVVHTALAVALFIGPSAWLFVVYALGLASTFPLHRKTHGKILVGVAFAVVWALLVQGVAVAVAAEEVSLGRRVGYLVLLTLPLVSLVVRRFETGAPDEWFSRRARSIVPLSFAIALLPLSIGLVGNANSDPARHDHARRTLGHNPYEAPLDAVVALGSAMLSGLQSSSKDGGLPELFASVIPEVVEARADRELRQREFGRTERSQRRWTDFQSAPRVDSAVRDEVNRACRRYAATDPERACECAHDLLVDRSREITTRRKMYRFTALASALPLGVAALFVWRGRRRRSDA